MYNVSSYCLKQHTISLCWVTEFYKISFPEFCKEIKCWFIDKNKTKNKTKNQQCILSLVVHANMNAYTEHWRKIIINVIYSYSILRLCYFFYNYWYYSYKCLVLTSKESFTVFVFIFLWTIINDYINWVKAREWSYPLIDQTRIANLN